MKSVILLLAVIVGLSGQGFASSSVQIHPRHESLILQAIAQECGAPASIVRMVLVDYKELFIDQGKTDIEYRIQISYFTQNEGLMNSEVNTRYFDQFDRESDDWGTYRILTLRCQK